MKDKFRNFLTVGMATATMATATDAQPKAKNVNNSSYSVTQEEMQPEKKKPMRPELKKDNPQRAAYQSYEAYQQYVEAMRDVKAEEENVKQLKEYEKVKEKLVKYLNTAEKNHQKDAKKNLEESIKRIDQMILEEKKIDPKKRYEDARALSLEDFQKTAVTINRAFEVADKERERFADIVYSDSYVEKAEREGLSTEDIKERQEAALIDIQLEDPFHDLSSGGVKVWGIYRPKGSPVVFGRKPGTYTLSTNESAISAFVFHEAGHVITDGGKTMSKKAMSLLKKGYSRSGNKEIDDYLSDSTEIDARKKQFERDLERSGIWKYGEPFTEEHLQKSIELRKNWELGGGSIEFLGFLEFMKHKKIIDIMNKIADNHPIILGSETEIAL
jgi:hypothetical protein